MIQRIILDDFLAHKHTELVLGPGVSTLTGPNNSGKSAIVEALRCVATNPTPKHVIRHGAPQARVEVVLDDGTSVVWARKPKTAWYELRRPGAEEPEFFRKLGRGMVPEEIRDALRLDPVELEGGTAIDVHIGDQKKPIFLLDADGADARLAEFFAASSESAHLIAMQKALQNRNREAKTRERTLRARLSELAQGLDRLSALPEVTRQGMLARELGNAAIELEKQLPNLERLLEKGRNLNRDLNKAQDRAAATRPLQAPPVPEDALTLERLLKEMSRLQIQSEHARSLSRTLAPLTATPEPVSTTNIKQLLLDVSTLEKLHKIAKNKAAAMMELQAMPALFNEEPLAGILSEIAGAAERLDRANTAALTRKEMLEAKRIEITERLKEIDACPLCGSRLDAASFAGIGEEV